MFKQSSVPMDIPIQPNMVESVNLLYNDGKYKSMLINTSVVVKKIREFTIFNDGKKLNPEEFNNYFEWLLKYILIMEKSSNNLDFILIIQDIVLHTLSNLIKYSILVKHLYCWYNTLGTPSGEGSIMEFCHSKFPNDSISYDTSDHWPKVIDNLLSIYHMYYTPQATNEALPIQVNRGKGPYQCDMVITASALRQFPMNAWIIRQYMKYVKRDNERDNSEKTKHNQRRNCITLWTPRETAPTLEDIQIIKESAKEVMDNICELFNNNDECFNIFLKYLRFLVDMKHSSSYINSHTIAVLENTNVFPFIHSLLRYKATTVTPQLIPYDLDQLYGVDIFNNDKYNIKMVANVVYKFPLSLLCYHPDYFLEIFNILRLKSNRDQKDGKNYVNLNPTALELDEMFSRNDIVPLPYTNEVIEAYFNHISSRDLSDERLKMKDINNQTCEEQLKYYIDAAEGFQLKLFDLEKKYKECIHNVEQYKDVELEMQQLRQQILDLSKSLRNCEENKTTLLSDKAKEIEDLQGQLKRQLENNNKELAKLKAAHEMELTKSSESLNKQYKLEIARIDKLRKKQYEDALKQEMANKEKLVKEQVSHLEAQLETSKTEKAAIEANRLVISQKVATLEAQLEANETKHAISLNDRDEAIGKLVKKLGDYDKAATAYVQQQAEKLNAATKQKEDISKQLKAELEAERSKLKVKDGELKESKTQAAKLGRELSAVKLQYTTQTEELGSKTKEKEQVERQLRETNQKNQDLTVQMNARSEEIRDLQGRMDSVKTRDEELKKQLESNKIDIAKLSSIQKELEDSNKNAEELRSALETAVKDKEAAEREKEENTRQLMEANETLNQQVEKGIKQNEALGKKLAEKSQEVAGLEDLKKQIETQTEELREQLNTTKTSLDDAQAKIETEQASLDKLNAELINATPQKVTELQNSVQAAEKEIRALKGAAELEQVRKKQLEDSALVNQGEIIKLTQELELAQTSNANLTQQQELAQKQLLQLREEADKNQSKLQEQLNIAKKNSSELASQINQSNDELQQAQNSKQALLKKMDEMKRAMANTQVTNSTGEGGHEKEKLQKLSEQYEELERKYTEEEKKTERLNQVVKDQQHTLESTIKEKEKLQAGITKERDSVEKMEKKLLTVEKKRKEQDELLERERGEVPSAQQAGKTLERAKVDAPSAFRYQPTNIKSLTHDDSLSGFDRFIEGVPINPISNTRTQQQQQQQQQQQFIYTSVVTAAKETNKLLSKPISSNRNVGYIPDFF